MDGTVDDLPNGKEEIYPVVANTDSKRGNCEWFLIEASTLSFSFSQVILVVFDKMMRPLGGAFKLYGF